jgi:glycosyltransferase involved in cell wall biosynthesis
MSLGRVIYGLMRLLHAIPSVDPSTGGPIQGVLSRVPILREMGHEVEIVSLDRPDQPWVRDCIAKVHAVGTGEPGYGFSPELVPWLQKHAQEYDVVVVDGLWQYHGVGVEAGLRGQKVPYFVFSHGMLDPWFRRRYPLKHLKKQAFWTLKQGRVLTNAKAVLFTCEEEKLQARNAFFPYRIRERVMTFGTFKPEKDPAVYLEAFHREFPQITKPFVLYLGRIHEKKGIDMLMEAFASMADTVEFDIVVAGPDHDNLGANLKRAADGAGYGDRVHWIGMVKDDAKFGALYASETFILPSHQENFGVAVAEALACGKPVLISNKVNIWREILEDEAAYVEDDDLAGTKNLLKRWANTPTAKREEMGRNAERCFDNRFEVHQSVETFLEALK